MSLRRKRAHTAVHGRLKLALATVVVLGLGADPAAGQLSSLAALSRDFESMAARVNPAVVQILVHGVVARSGIVSSTEDLFERQRVTGSGVILDPEGYVVTNAHVVDGARRIQVLVPPASAAPPAGRSILAGRGRLVGAQLVGVDRETDLAVLKIPLRDLPALELGDSDSLRKGQIVFAFGSPLGLTNSVSMGIVSSVARQLRPEDPMIYVQTDAPINPGNSGGPLTDVEGRVVGINTLIFSQSGGSEGVGFAAPSNIVRTVYRQLRDTGIVRRGEIGVHAQTVTPLLAAGLGLQRDTGVILGDVRPGGPAARAGLRIGDLVLRLDGKTMENARQLDVNVYGKSLGSKVRLEVLRGDEVLAFGVTVIERADARQALLALANPERNLVEPLGILALDLTGRLRGMLPALRHERGVVVAGRAAEAPFRDAGLLPGDVIFALNGKRIDDLEALRKALEAIRLYDAVVLHVERQGVLMYVALERDQP